jgi:hypothetical protein
MFMKKLIFVVFLLGSALAGVTAQNVSSAYRKEAFKLFDASGVTASFSQLVPQMLQQIKALAPSVPNEFWIETQSQFQGTALRDSMLSDMVDVYAKYYTMDDLKSMNKFYATSIGKKWGDKSANLSAATMQIQKQWVLALRDKVFDKMVAAGYKINNK